MSRAKQPCCCCPTKEEAGLPNEFTALFSVLSRSAEGMPSPQPIGGCYGDYVNAVFSHSSAIADLLAAAGDIKFDYSESGVSACGAACCFRYVGRTNYTRECKPPGDDGTAILLGASPFTAYAVGSYVSETIWLGSPGAIDPAAQCGCGPFYWFPIGTPLPTGCSATIEGLGPISWCCGVPRQAYAESEVALPDCLATAVEAHYFFIDVSGESCAAALGNSRVWSSGTEYEGTMASARADFYICVEGSVATICANISIAIECKTRTGNGTTTDARKGGGCTDGSCAGIPAEHTYSGIEACHNSTTSAISLTATANLALVSGVTLWEKLKNAVWESNYETAHCNCGSGGCIDTYEAAVNTGCYLDCNCDGVGEDTDYISEPNYIRHLDCLYAVGEMGVTLDD